MDDLLKKSALDQLASLLLGNKLSTLLLYRLVTVLNYMYMYITHACLDESRRPCLRFFKIYFVFPRHFSSKGGH